MTGSAEFGLHVSRLRRLTLRPGAGEDGALELPLGRGMLAHPDATLAWMGSRSVRRELISRAVAVIILGGVSVWAITRHSWVVAGITGVLAVVTLGSLALGFVVWRRGLLK
jgi:hypothetical protein